MSNFCRRYTPVDRCGKLWSSIIQNICWFHLDQMVKTIDFQINFKKFLLSPSFEGQERNLRSLGRLLNYFWASLELCLGLTFFQFLPWHQVRDQSGWQWWGELQVITWPFAGKARTKCGGSAGWLDRVSLTHEECTTMEAWPQKGKLHNYGKVVNKNVSNES